MIPYVIGIPFEKAQALCKEASYPIEIGKKTKTNQFLPGCVLSFLSLPKENEVTYVEVTEAPEGSESFDDSILYTYSVGYITGPKSQNWDLLEKSHARECDLGIPVSFKNKLCYLFGDTFDGNALLEGNWNSNYIAYTKQKSFEKGVIFDNVMKKNKKITPIFQGDHDANVWDKDSNANREVTKIPTGGIEINGYLYVFLMCVRSWEEPGEWKINKNILVRSKDLKNFEEVKEILFPESTASFFGQIYPFRNPKDQMIYLFGIPGGRSGGVTLARVLEQDFLNPEAYEYYTKDGYIKGNEGLKSLQQTPNYIVEPKISELSFMYNEYLKKYMLISLDRDLGYITYRVSDSIEGKYSEPKKITKGYYGSFCHPWMTKYNGKKFYITVSEWIPIYQVSMIEVVLN